MSSMAGGKGRKLAVSLYSLAIGVYAKGLLVKNRRIDAGLVSGCSHQKPRVAFICVHNSCRSQIAEALGRKLASDVFESYSAGTAAVGRINPDAQRLMLERYGIDMEGSGQRSKTIMDIPHPDIAILMGCGVSCPSIVCNRVEDWGLEDPTGKSDDEFLRIIAVIEDKIRELKGSLEAR